jgi:uncharacterized membrane protein
MKTEIIDLLSTLDPKIYILVLSMLPIFEARYAVIAAFALNLKNGTMPWDVAYYISILGNVSIIIPLLYALPHLDRTMHRWTWTGKLIDFFLYRARKRHDLILKYGFWGLTIFVALPLPVTGAWTGTLMAYLFNIPLKKAVFAIFVGVIIATSIMTFASYGGLSIFSFLLTL